MKIQDIGFIVVLVALLVIRKPIFLIVAGLICFVLAMPLFAFWVFFTAERLVMYGAGFIFVGAFLILLKK